MLPPVYRTFDVTTPDARSPYQVTATKASREVEDYGFAWDEMLVDEAIVACQWEVLQGTVVLSESAIVDDCTVVTIAGGVRGEFAQVACVATTGSGRRMLALISLYVS